MADRADRLVREALNICRDVRFTRLDSTEMSVIWKLLERSRDVSPVSPARGVRSVKLLPSNSRLVNPVQASNPVRLAMLMLSAVKVVIVAISAGVIGSEVEEMIELLINTV